MKTLVRSMACALVILGVPALGSAATPVRKAPPRTPAKAAKKKTKGTKKLSAAARHKKHMEFLKVMGAEMKRNLAQFAKMKQPKVYHLRYRMQITRQVNLRATDGNITGQSNSLNSPRRQIKVDLRVGNHKFDHTGRDGYDWRIYKSLLGAGTYCPVELTPFALRKMLWRNTDRHYRLGVGQYWRKRYVRSIKPKILDKAGDLSKEPPTVYMAPLQPELTFNMKRWKGILKRISKLTRNAPRVIRAGVSVTGWEKIILGVGNDGSKVRLRKRGYTWSVALAYRGKSKELIQLGDAGYASKESELPSEAKLRASFLHLWKNAKAQLEAEEGDPDEGPAIVDPAIAGALFYDILMVRLESGRFLRKRDPRTFAKKLGQAIIPSFLSIIDNPLMTYWGKTPLSASYPYDDQWVPAKRLVMIKNGVLQRFYTSRKPYKTFKRSNGHGRAAFGYKAFSRPGVTIVKSTRAYSPAELRQKLAAEIRRQGKRYGYILTRFQGSSQVRRSIYSVTPEQLLRYDIKTGKTKRLKGLQVRTAALQVIRGIIATGNDYKVFNGSDSESSGSIQITTVAPSLLLKRLSFHRTNLSEKKTYQIPAPFKTTTLQSVVQSKAPAGLQCPKTCPKICKQCQVCK